jgi:hypothetical protein
VEQQSIFMLARANLMIPCMSTSTVVAMHQRRGPDWSQYIYQVLHMESAYQGNAAMVIESWGCGEATC